MKVAFSALKKGRVPHKSLGGAGGEGNAFFLVLLGT